MIRSPDADAIAAEIGWVCIMWGRLEHHLGDLLEDYIGIADSDTKQIVLNELDIRSRLRLCKHLAIQLDGEGFRDVITTLCDSLDNVVRPLRNDHVHGLYETEEAPTRHGFKTKVRKQPVVAVTTGEATPVVVEEIRMISIIIEKAAEVLARYRRAREAAALRPSENHLTLRSLELGLDEFTQLIARYTSATKSSGA